MRILVLSDLHSNATALDAVPDAAQDRWDLSVCLGDVVGYGPDPNEVTARLRELGTQTIRGNHDKAVTGLMATDDFNVVAKSAVEWTRAQLQPEHLAWLSALPHGPLATDGVVLVQARFRMRTNTSLLLRRPSTASWTPPLQSLFLDTRTTRAAFPIRTTSSRSSGFALAPPNPFPRSPSNLPPPTPPFPIPSPNHLTPIRP